MLLSAEVYRVQPRARWDATSGSKSATESPRPNGAATAVTPAGKSRFALGHGGDSACILMWTRAAGFDRRNPLFYEQFLWVRLAREPTSAFAPFSSASKGRARVTLRISPWRSPRRGGFCGITFLSFMHPFGTSPKPASPACAFDFLG